MRVVITGGAGFVGHNVALYLLGRGYDVLVVDGLERASPLGIRRLKDVGVDVIRADVGDLLRVPELVRGVDFLVHAAAYVSVKESMEKPELYMENNVLSTLAVARVCLRFNVPVIYLSSAAVYGEPLELPIAETHPTNPTSPYGLSKLFGEQILELYSRYGLRSVALRLFNVYGPGQIDSYAGVITRFIKNALKGSELVIYGDGGQTRDFIHVRDVAKAVELTMEKQVYGGKFNIASGRPTTINELAKIVGEVVRERYSIRYEPPRSGDIRHSYADISKARKVLGFEPSITLEKGIKELVDIMRHYELSE